MATMFNRRIRLALNSFVVSAMLFAQYVDAAQACAESRDTPQMAFVDTRCGEMSSQNVCLHQYVSDFQNSGATQVPVADFSRIVVLAIAAFPVERHLNNLHDYLLYRQSSSDPPPTIRFCSFQI